ncbi:MAG: DUF1844 domain-containing protein [Bdellovibrionaceae bacterium]|nr:DUF1844 domain-containing protein [Pseudobdellovibrionaceae bacterium]
MTQTESNAANFQATFSVLLTSLASSAVMSMGLAPDPNTGQTHKDKPMARFNIDLLMVLKEKTKGNLTQDEDGFLNALLSDLQMKFVQMKD